MRVYCEIHEATHEEGECPACERQDLLDRFTAQTSLEIQQMAYEMREADKARVEDH